MTVFSILKCQLKAFADDRQLYTCTVLRGPTNKYKHISTKQQIKQTSGTNRTCCWPTRGNLYYSTTIKGTLRDTPNIKVKVKGIEIEQTSVLKLLGVQIDDKLNLGEQAKNTCIKMSRQVGVPLRLKNIIPERAKLQLYKAAIMPHLTYMYCSTVWHFIRASDQCKLERVQERALRAVYRDKNSDYEELLTKAYIT